MRRSLGPGIAVAVALLATACITYSPSPFSDSVRFPENGGPYVLPTEMCGGFFVVDAWVNGTGPWPLLLDSGAGRTVLDPRVREAAGIRWMVDSLRVGEFEVFRFGAHELDMTALSGALGRDVVGILGHPLFAELLMTWDPGGGSVLLERGDLEPGMEWVVPARNDHRPWVGSVVDGDTLWILVGQEVLRHTRITFDQRNDLIRIEPMGGDASEPVSSPPVRTPGYAVSPGTDGAEVIQLFDGLAPEGIQVGDVILSVNGARWTERGCPGARSSDGASVTTLEVQRGDSIFTLTAPVHTVHPLPEGDSSGSGGNSGPSPGG